MGIVTDPNKAPLFGVIGPSHYNSFLAFINNVASGDVMHDLFEGICPMIVMCLLKQASSLRLLSYGRNV